MSEVVRIQSCGGHACKAGGINEIFVDLAEVLGVDPEKGGVTADEKFELVRGVACQGKCGVGPIVTVWHGENKYVFTRMDGEKVKKIISAFSGN